LAHGSHTLTHVNSPSFLELDVRPLIAGGRQPLPVILAAVNRLEPGQSLRLIAPFEPTPLYAVLRQRGLIAESQVRTDGAWEIIFRPSP
jgi:uncharacterized protein (DUF2249 family)